VYRVLRHNMNHEEQSAKKAAQMGLDFDNRLDCEYMHEIYNHDSGNSHKGFDFYEN